MTAWKVTVTARGGADANTLLERLSRFEGANVNADGSRVSATFNLDAPSVKRACRAALVIFERADGGEITKIVVEAAGE